MEDNVLRLLMTGLLVSLAALFGVIAAGLYYALDKDAGLTVLVVAVAGAATAGAWWLSPIAARLLGWEGAAR